VKSIVVLNGRLSVTTKKIWDSLTKELMQAGPQDLISWIFPNALYTGELDTELLKEPVRADCMYTITWEGEQVGFHIEFQKRHDTNMGRRVWRYNALASDRTDLPIYSVVIYLVDDERSVVEPPYAIKLPNGEIIHYFMFRNIKLWEIPSEALLEQNLPGLLPLLPLTREGHQRETVEQMYHRLQQAGKTDLIAIGFSIAFHALTQENEHQWLKEIFMDSENILEGTWLGDKIHEKGVIQGLEQGRKQVFEQFLPVQRASLRNFVKMHFPAEFALANRQVELIMTPFQAQELLDKLTAARTDDEVEAILLSIPHA
jgi:predicted transposase YdaD